MRLKGLSISLQYHMTWPHLQLIFIMYNAIYYQISSLYSLTLAGIYDALYNLSHICCQCWKQTLYKEIVTIFKLGFTSV